MTCASKDYLKYRPHVKYSGVIMIVILYHLIIVIQLRRNSALEAHKVITYSYIKKISKL